ncbi:MAG: ABC transporter permease [Pseudomonadota bacterium]
MTTLLHSLRYQIQNDLHNRFVGSLLGAYWAVINPLLQVLIYVFVVAVVFRAKLGGTSTPFEYALFCLSGLGSWLAFQEGLNSSATSITRNAAIVKNTRFPPQLFPVSAVLCSLIPLVSSYGMLLILRGIDGHWPGVALLALPVVVVTQVLLAFGVGLILSVCGVLFRDILQILPILLQLLMLATPVLYERQDLPSGLQFLSLINPLYYLIDAYRQILFYGAWPNFWGLAAVAVLGIVLTWVGATLFRIARGYFEALV